MNTIYRQGDGLFPTVDSKYVAKQYLEYSVKIAEHMTKLNEINQHVKYLHECTNDNGDVGLELDEAILKLGIALADSITYSHEYQQEADGTNEEENLDGSDK